MTALVLTIFGLWFAQTLLMAWYIGRLRKSEHFWWLSYLHATTGCWGPLARPHCETEGTATE